MGRPRKPLPPQNRPRYLTNEQLATIRAAWAAGLPRDEVCRAAGITQHVLAARRLDQLADLPARRRGVGGGRRPDDPTEEQIWGPITKAIQQEWTDEERQAAWEGSRRHDLGRH